MFEEFTNEIKAHALQEYPKESCGYIVRGKYYPQINIHETPETAFRVDPAVFPDGLEAVVHSHPDEFPVKPTKTDMEGQVRTNVPWGIVNTSVNNNSILWWGHRCFVPPLHGREYRPGPSGSDGRGDCYALIKDYYLLTRDIELKEFPRDEVWWDTTENPMYEKHYRECGFMEIEEHQLQVGDVFLMQWKFPVLHHGGIYLGNGKGLHHLELRLSREESLPRWKKYIRKYLRYVG